MSADPTSQQETKKLGRLLSSIRSQTTMDSPPLDGFVNDPPPDISDSIDPPPLNPVPYSSDNAAYVLSVAREAFELFPTGKIYANSNVLKQEDIEFAGLNSLFQDSPYQANIRLLFLCRNIKVFSFVHLPIRSNQMIGPLPFG